MVDADVLDGLASERSEAGRARKWVCVVCGDRPYGIALEKVREIMTPQPLTRLPGCDAEVAGLVGVRGRVVTVLDLGRILGVGASVSLPDHRLLLVDHGERVVGIAVDDVRAVVDGVVRPVEAASPLSGSVSCADGSFSGLDVDAVIGRCLA